MLVIPEKREEHTAFLVNEIPIEIADVGVGVERIGGGSAAVLATALAIVEATVLATVEATVLAIVEATVLATVFRSVLMISIAHVAHSAIKINNERHRTQKRKGYA